MMNMGIGGKTAFVMGGSSGIGKAVASSLIENGASVAICGRNAEKLEASCRDIGAFGVKGDLSVSADVSRMLGEVENKLGGIDILVTNTGGPPKTYFLSANEKMWHGAFNNLFMSVVLSVQHVLPRMKERNWGRVIMISSMAAKEPVEGLVLSNSIRSGLTGLSKTLSNETAGYGITVNVILPGFMETDRLKNLGLDMNNLAGRIPAGRIGKPEELGALAAFLASDNAGYITGQAIGIDGGYTKSI